MKSRKEEKEKECTQTKFQEELDKWFQSHGILSDLRSHLRHLMVLALQNTQAGMKPNEEVSPKQHAINLLVAEYLLRRDCHYTLSVLTSEIPSLKNFLRGSYEGNLVRTKPLGIDANDLPKRTRLFFQDYEIVEIFNALGVSSHFDGLEEVKNSYSIETNKCSLLELFLQFVLDNLLKMSAKKKLESFWVERKHHILSDTWAANIADILLNEKINEHQIASIQKSIYSVTENELARVSEIERKKQAVILAEREKRIQERLKKYEEEIFDKLVKAERELNNRKDDIADELTERHKYLSKMIVEWNVKHTDIMRISKKFYKNQDKKKILENTIKELEIENKNLKIEEEKQTEVIFQLRNQLDLLMDKLNEFSKCKEDWEQHVQNFDKYELHTSGQDPCPTLKDAHTQITVEKPLDKSYVKSKDDNYSQLNTFKNPSNEDDISQSESSSEEILLQVRNKLFNLEEESSRIQKNYMKYKTKYKSPINSDSDSFTISLNEKYEEEFENFNDENKAFTLKESKFSQTDLLKPENKPKSSKENKKLGNEIKINNYSKETLKGRFDLKEELTAKTVTNTLNERQLKNRKYFLKSRQLLQEFEKDANGELNALSSSSGSELNNSGFSEGHFHVSSNKNGKDFCLSSPSKSVKSFTAASKKEKTEKEMKMTIEDKEVTSETVKVDTEKLASPKLKPEKRNINLLRQEILLADSAETIEIIETKKSDLEAVTAMPQSESSQKSTSSEGISVGKESEGGMFW